MVKKKKSGQQEMENMQGGANDKEHAGQAEGAGKKEKNQDKEINGNQQDDEKSEQEKAGETVDTGDTGEDMIAGTGETQEAGPGHDGEKLKEAQDRYLRLSAEFDNYRKRTLKEKSDLIKLAGEDIISGLLPVLDDFDRALHNLDKTTEVDPMKKGVELIHSKLNEFLRQKGVKEIKALGKEFDTDLHEAVTKIPVEEKKNKGKIVDVIEKGYLLHDKVIRYAKVVVGE